MKTTLKQQLHRLALTSSVVVLLATGAVSSSSPAGATTKHTGTVEVLSCGSFSNVMTLLEAAFKKDTGYTIQDTSEGSSAIASGIVAKTLQGDVFISASTAADTSIEGAANGNWISSYTLFGSSPDVLAYNPRSSFASALKKRPWYNVVRSSGFELGRTDPTVDPGGVLDVDALDGIGYAYNIPNLLTIAASTGNVYTEDAIPGLIQSGQLDAGFMYAISADAANLPYAPLTGTKNLNGKYTVATLKGAPDPAPAAAFVKWMLAKQGQAILIKQGIVPVSPFKVVRAS
jgi:molybdate/tungstate transport system substrate-binding protein